MQMKKQEARRKKEEARRKKEEARSKKQEGRRKKEGKLLESKSEDGLNTASWCGYKNSRMGSMVSGRVLK